MGIIDIKNLQVSYGDFKALRGVTCCIEGGAIGLLGPNGAGKSTLLKTLLGFIRPAGGEVSMFGFPLPAQALAVRQKLGYMPERDVVSPKISAVSFLTYCGCLFGMSRVDAMERAHEVLNYVKLGDNRYRKMETYSTGMCQRVKFAQALIHDPKLLLLDEPTSGLDPEGRIEMLDLINELAHERKVTVMLSTHLLPDVEHVCDRVLIISKGKIRVDSDLQSLTERVDGLYSVRVRDNVNVFQEALAAAGFECKPERDGRLLVSTGSPNGSKTLFEVARNCQTHIRHFQPVRHNLESAFVQAVAADDSEGENSV